ncbi:hypothetical protein MAHJHV29_49820 [Mycobacterium avium subsp. hominissuis]
MTSASASRCSVPAQPAAAAAGWAGTEHLDAFADVIAGYAERADASVPPVSARSA